MKKCKHCGTVQNDSRTTCVDCGKVLSHPMSEAEEEAVNEALDDQLDNYTERTDDFYVPLRDKIMGVICIIGIVAAVLLLNFAGTENKQLKTAAGITEYDGPSLAYVTGSVSYITEENGVATMHTGRYSTPRTDVLDSAVVSALVALVCFVGAAPMLLFPRFMWLLDTLKYRLFYNWDTTPSDFALIMRKIVTYLLFVVGVGAISYGYILFL